MSFLALREAGERLLRHSRRQSQQRVGSQRVGFEFTDFRQQQVGGGAERCGPLCQRCGHCGHLRGLDRLNRDGDFHLDGARLNRWRLASAERKC
jgi:hypothetical protein